MIVAMSRIGYGHQDLARKTVDLFHVDIYRLNTSYEY
jgi:tRNA A37 threonylcarbamoyladenosine biosynthesis protein TsaE